MADGIEVARAYVTIIPSLEGSQKTITKELTGATEEAGEKAGKKSGDKFSGSFSSKIKSGAAVIGAAIAGATAAAAGPRRVCGTRHPLRLSTAITSISCPRRSG